jgi:hypothetical protein
LCKPTRLPEQAKQKQESNTGKLSSVGGMSKKQLKSELKELKKQKKKIKKRLKRDPVNNFV